MLVRAEAPVLPRVPPLPKAGPRLSSRRRGEEDGSIAGAAPAVKLARSSGFGMPSLKHIIIANRTAQGSQAVPE